MAYPKHRAQRTRKFEEEVKDQTTETTTEEGGEESTPDSQEQLITTLTEMGLSAEQAEAVYQMAMDLVKAGGAPEGDAQETQMARARRRAKMARMRRNRDAEPRREFSRSRGFEPRGRRPEGRRFSESPRGRRPMESRGRRFSESNGMEAMLRRQRREIMELKRQLREFGAQPAAAPARTQSAFAQQPAAPTGNSVLDRVLAKMKG